MIVPRKDASPHSASEHLDCALTAYGCLSLRGSELAVNRNRIASLYDGTLSPSVLKQADDQSVVALLALHQTTRGKARPDGWEQWGLVACPRMLGRRRIAESLVKYREQGAWSTSPHVIPHCSLHSLPGLLSQALQLHGPNIGAGGVYGSEPEAFWTAIGLLHGEELPGVLMVFTGWREETLNGESICQAAVVAIERQAPGWPSLRFSRVSANGPRPERLSLERLIGAMETQQSIVGGCHGAIISIDFTSARLEAAA